MDPKTGRKRYHSEAVKGTKALAQRRLTELLRQVDTGALVEPSRLTVGEYLEQWLRDSVKGRVSNRALEGYRGTVARSLFPKVGKAPLEKFTAWQVQVMEMESELLEGGGRNGKPLSPRTVLQAHTVLSKSLNDAVNLGIVSPNVMVAVKPPKVTKYEARTFSWEQVYAFLDGIPDPLYATLPLLDNQAGLRRSELMGLRWHDVNFFAGTLTVNRALIKPPSGEIESTVL